MLKIASMVLILMAFTLPGAVAQCGTLSPIYNSFISPGGLECGLGTIKSGGSSVTITPASIVAVSDSAATESFGSISWAPSVPMTVTLTFNYQIANPGSNIVVYRADWFSETFVYTDGTVKAFSQSFDISDQVLISVKVKNGSVSISSISVQ